MFEHGGGKGEQGIWNSYVYLIFPPKDLLFPAVIFLETLIIGAGDVSTALSRLKKKTPSE